MAKQFNSNSVGKNSYPHVYEHPDPHNPHPPGHHFILSKIMIFALLILLIFTVGTGIYLANFKFRPKPIAIKPTPTIPNPTTTPVDETATWKTYENKKLGFSIKYPSDWTLEESTNEYSDRATFSSPWDGSLEDKPALVTIDLVKKSEFNTEWINNQTPYDYKTIEKDDMVFVIAAKTYQIGSQASKEIEDLAKNILLKMAPTFKLTEQADKTQCTLEAKLCPDGSTVGRKGPNCEFTKCPSE